MYSLFEPQAAPPPQTLEAFYKKLITDYSTVVKPAPHPHPHPHPHHPTPSSSTTTTSTQTTLPTLSSLSISQSPIESSIPLSIFDPSLSQTPPPIGLVPSISSSSIQFQITTTTLPSSVSSPVVGVREQPTPAIPLSQCVLCCEEHLDVVKIVRCCKMEAYPCTSHECKCIGSVPLSNYSESYACQYQACSHCMARLLWSNTNDAMRKEGRFRASCAFCKAEFCHLDLLLFNTKKPHTKDNVKEKKKHHERRRGKSSNDSDDSFGRRKK